MFDHINTFAEAMTQLGYDGNFHSPFGFYDRLKENLTKHVFQCFEEKKKLEPFDLATYTHWKDNDSPYVRCSFRVHYTPQQGFEARHLNIEYGNSFGGLRHKDIAIDHSNQIPHRLEANSLMLEKKHHLKM